MDKALQATLARIIAMAKNAKPDQLAQLLALLQVCQGLPQVTIDPTEELQAQLLGLFSKTFDSVKCIDD